MSPRRARGARVDDPDRARRRADLLDAADRVIREAGPAASMSAIAAEAGITKPILYRHFGDKGGLYAALADRYIAPLLAGVRGAMASTTAPDRVRATIEAYLGFIEDHQQVYRFLMHSAETPETKTAVSATIRRLGEEIGIILREQAGLHGERAVVADALGHGIVGMVHVAGDWWLDDGRLSREQLAEHLTGLLMTGLAGLGGLDGQPAPDG
jgi:AcrR family transcriptional regulator